MITSDGHFIDLTARPLSPNEFASHSASHISSSAPFLDEDLSSSSNPRMSEWTAKTLSKSPTRSRRKPSRSGDGFSEKMISTRRKGPRICLKLGCGLLLLLGVVELFSLIGSLVRLVLPNGVHHFVKSWGRPGHVGAWLSSWPTDFSRDILPIPCHSHNDYWRTVPLYSAIEVGCIGVEADIWLFDEQLCVGHSVASLTPNRTINSLYIDPLLDILSKQNPERTVLPQRGPRLNGVFDTTPEQSLIFLIDFKTAGDTLWPHVQSALEPLRRRNYLTHSNGTEIIPGPITVVGTGNTPFMLVNSNETNPYHDIFFDAPLSSLSESRNDESSQAASNTVVIPHQMNEQLQEAKEGDSTAAGEVTFETLKKRSDEEGQGKSGTDGDDPTVFNPANSFYASVAFGEAIGHLTDGEFSQHQMVLLRDQVRGAHTRGLKARYWDLPFWPISLRNHVWDVLVKEGVDLLNVDDLKGATKRNWSKHHGWWK